MNKILSPQLRTDLLKRHKTERDGRIRDRLKVILWSDEGWTQERIAKALFINEETVREHLRIYKEEKRLTGDHKGSDPILTHSESQELSDHLESIIYTKIKDIQSYVVTTFYKEMSYSAVYQWLQVHQFRYKKPKTVPKDVDPAQQQEFIDLYNCVMTEAALDNDPVLFGDSVHPSQQTRLAYGWIKKGQDKPIETTSARKRLNIMGALNLETMGFAWQDFETINAESAVCFLKIIERHYPDAQKIHLIWDQAGYHTAKEVQEFLQTSRIRVHYLPPRSPNLNPIERLWKVMHEYTTNNKPTETFKKFSEAIFNFMSNTIPSIVDMLVDRITDNFQIIIPGK